jgi:hemoglobin-like flavoprotein
MESQALAGVDQQVAAQGYQDIQALYQAGVKESGMATDLFSQIMQANGQQNATLTSAIGNFAGGLAGASTKSGS